MSKSAIIIPARWASTRFPGKPLIPLMGKPLIQHVWERCCEAEGISSVIVATDDMRIAEAAFGFGAEVSLTKSTHLTGTDRLGEVAMRLRGISHVINVQGDEPAIDPGLISSLAAELQANRKLQMITAAAKFPAKADLADPNTVKVIVDQSGHAIYFSRAEIPFFRNPIPAARPLQHLGIYGFRIPFLLDFVQWNPTPLELAESLEQLRAIEHGVKIRVVTTEKRSVGVDVPADIAIAERELRRLHRMRRAAVTGTCDRG